MEVAFRSWVVKTEDSPLSPNDYFRPLVDSVRDYAIFGVTPDGRIATWNPGAEKMFGYQAEEIIGTNRSQLDAADRAEKEQPDLDFQSSADTNQGQIHRLQVRKDGSLFHAIASISRLTDNGGFVHVVRELKSDDVIEPRSSMNGASAPVATEKLNPPNETEQVEFDLHDQTRIEQMEAEKDEAEKANKAKDEFLAMLSHELRTPLTPALVAATYLAEIASLPQDLHEEVATIRRNIQLEARLIDDLLDFTRLIRGKVELHFEVVDAHRLIHEIVEVVGDDIIEKELDVKISLTAREHHIWADPVRIRQVFWNLIRNAAKFTPARGQIKIRSANSNEGRFELGVSDTGVGIEPSEQNEIFNAFRQESRSITREFGGLGLGLTISKSLVDLHHGTIEVESSGKNRGASFKVILDPVHESAIVKELCAKRCAANEKLAPAPGRRSRRHSSNNCPFAHPVRPQSSVD